MQIVDICGKCFRYPKYQSRRPVLGWYAVGKNSVEVYGICRGIMLLPSPSFHVIVLHIVLMAGTKPLASQSLLVSLLHLDVATLQLECSGESAAWPHSWKVLGRVNCEDVAQYFSQDWGVSSNVQVHRVDAHQDEPQAVLAMCATRQIRKTEEAAFDVMLILGDRRRCDQLPHQSPCCSTVGLDQCGFLIRTLRVPERAMHHIKRVPKLLLFCHSRLGICD
jgi:hypothetical protein